MSTSGPPPSPWNDNRERYHHRQPAGAASSRPPAHTGVRPWAWISLVGIVLVLGFLVAAQFVHVPKVVTRPGPVYDTLGDNGDGVPVVQIDGAETYDTSGTLDLTTVVQDGGPGYPLTMWDYLMAELFEPEVAIYDYADLYDTQDTQEGVREQNVALMDNSAETAGVVALRAAGYEVPEEVSVAGLAADAPAEGVLEEGDRFLTVDGTAVATAADVQEAVRAREPGEEVPMTVLREDEEVEVSVPTADSDGTTVVGAFLASAYDPPVTVTINAGNVGGPSAGLMFSLAAYDKLTEGDLTGGASYAGTGTIDSGGNVGGIGGIAQKMVGAHDAGAEYFLAPGLNCPQVLEADVPEGLEVIRVDTMENALDSLELISAGNTADLPRC